MKYIAIAGNIASGKTTLAKHLCNVLNAEAVLEDFASHPFLRRFYSNPRQYAMGAQIAFVLMHYYQLMESTSSTKKPILISDYIFEAEMIFAGINLDSEQQKVLGGVYRYFYKQIVKPDLVIFLESDVQVLLDRIQRRNRRMEKTISADYLSRIGEGYKKLASDYPLDSKMIVQSTPNEDVGVGDVLRHLTVAVTARINSA